jgi:tetratricopeptide (TPR) repeat protein
MGMALRIEPSGSDLNEALEELTRARDLATDQTLSSWTSTELAIYWLAHSDLARADAHCQEALDHNAHFGLALEVGGIIARRRGDLLESAKLLEAAEAVLPAYANASMELAVTLALSRSADARDAAWQRALARASRAQHQVLLQRQYEISCRQRPP